MEQSMTITAQGTAIQGTVHDKDSIRYREQSMTRTAQGTGNRNAEVNFAGKCCFRVQICVFLPFLLAFLLWGRF